MRAFLLSAAGVMFAAGFAAGPAYYLYCQHFSGQEVVTLQIAGRASSWTLPEGITLRFPGRGAFKPVGIDLDPLMNPVGFNWRGRVSGTVMRQREHNEYGAALYFADRREMAETFSISRGEKDSGVEWKWVSIGVFMVPRAGRYHFVLEELGNPRLSVGGMQIEVRRNVVVPSMPVVMSGLGLLIAGCLLGMVVALVYGKTYVAPSPFPSFTRRQIASFVGIGVVVIAAPFLVVFWHIAKESDPPPDLTGPAKPPTVPSPASVQTSPPAAKENPPADQGPIVISEISPRSARIGQPITLRGSNFGSRENHTVSIGGHGIKVPLEVIEWTRDAVTVRIPEDPRIVQDRAYYYRIERLEPRESSNLSMFTFQAGK